ncbi:MAG: ABC transporter ATP-binding protein [bacterium]|nr:ABC transporter ATP-binding protein [bacterium]
MHEHGSRGMIAEQESPKKRVDELSLQRNELMEAKKQSLEHIKTICRELFGIAELPKDIVDGTIDIRKKITKGVEGDAYSATLHQSTAQDIRSLALTISRYKEKLQGATTAVDGTESLTENEEELLASLEAYFDSYRLVQNAHHFRKNTATVKESMLEEHANRKLNFYSEEEKQRVFMDRLKQKYSNAGFTEAELHELVALCDVQSLATLEIHDIKALAKIKDIFSRFMQGDTTKYVGMSAALLIPAFIQGYAPNILAEAFKKGSAVDVEQVLLFAVLTLSATGASTMLQKNFKKFMDENFRKEKGFAESIAENVAEMPSHEIGIFGLEAIKNRIAHAKEGYEHILRLISFDVAPAMVTITTSAVMLYERSPILAGGTALGTGLMLALDKFVQKKGRFWEKEGKAQTAIEKSAKQLEEQLSAHMEIILSGEKDKFKKRIEMLMGEERVAASDKKLLGTIQEKIYELYGAIDMTIAGIAAYIAGGSFDKFIAAIIYSGGIKNGIQTLLRSKRNLLSSFRDIHEMDMMFNGYAAEERENEKDRIGINDIANGDIVLDKVCLGVGKKAIVNNVSARIPTGAMVSLGGVSGSGKTTLMKILSGYYRPTSGDVTFGGVAMEKIKKSGPDSLYSKIAYLPQFPYMMNGTAKDNLLFGMDKDIPEETLRAILKEVGLEKRFKNLHEVLEGGRGDTGGVSGGESSRIGLARVLLKLRNSDARIVFLDEPTASVDKETSNDIAEVINKEKAARPHATFIVISHDKDFIGKLRCDTAINLKNGVMVQ